MSLPKLKLIKNILFEEKECIKFLLEQNILKNQTCCNLVMNRGSNVKYFRCKNQNCNKTITIFKNSIFEKSRICCSNILLLAYLWLCEVKYKSISITTRYSPNTIVKFINKFQNLVNNTLTGDDFMIGGRNVIVEIDETKMRKNETFWIVGGVERTARRKCFFVIADNRDKETLRHIIKQHVREGSIVHTDHWKGYSCVSELGFRHRRVNHSKNRIQRGTGVHSNTIEVFVF
jgi:IS1 family transposase/phage antirepressor YoqD-like protein